MTLLDQPKKAKLTQCCRAFSPDVTSETITEYALAFARISLTITSTVATWNCHAREDAVYSSVVASSAVTIVVCMCFDRRLGQAAFCGTFAGMSGPDVVPNINAAIWLASLTSILYEVVIQYYDAFLGIGGRLGVTAMVATSIVAAAQGVSTGVTASVISLTALKSRTLVLTPLWYAVGSLATLLLRQISDDSAAKDSVRASAVVGLIAALLIRDEAVALAIYGGSFSGMSLPTRLMHGMLPGDNEAERDLEETSASFPHAEPPSIIANAIAFGIAGAFGGIIHGIIDVFGFWPGGWGGKAGSCAFIGCLIYRGAVILSSVVKIAILKYTALVHPLTIITIDAECECEGEGEDIEKTESHVSP